MFRLIANLLTNNNFRESIGNEVEVASKGESGIESDDMILDLSKSRLRKIKEYETKRRETTTSMKKRNLPTNASTNSTLINYEYHPIITFFNDY